MSQGLSKIAEPVFFAHSLPGQPPSNWEPLEVHLENVAELAARFAGEFGIADWGRVAGLWHDLGKYSDAFQRYLRGACLSNDEDAEVVGRVDHSTAGATAKCPKEFFDDERAFHYH